MTRKKREQRWRGNRKRKIEEKMKGYEEEETLGAVFVWGAVCKTAFHRCDATNSE